MVFPYPGCHVVDNCIMCSFFRLTSFIQECALATCPCLPFKNQMAIFLWAHSWLLYSVPSVHLCLHYRYDAMMTVAFSKHSSSSILYWLFCVFCFSMYNMELVAFFLHQIMLRDFYWDCVDFINEVRKQLLDMVEVPGPEHALSLYLLPSSLLSFTGVLLFSPCRSCIYLIKLTPKYFIWGVGPNIDAIVFLF